MRTEGLFETMVSPAPVPDQDSPSEDLWVNLDPDMVCRDPLLLELHRYWDSKRNGRRFPSRRDIDPAEIPRYLGNVFLIDVSHEPLRLRYRLLGTRITDVMRRDSTGKFYDEIYAPDLLEAIYRSFHWMFENGQPLRTHGENYYPDRNFYTYEALNLPLSANSETIDMVFGGLVFHPKFPPKPDSGLDQRLS